VAFGSNPLGPVLPQSSDRSLSPNPVPGGSIEYEAMGEGATFLSPPLKEETEITGRLREVIPVFLHGDADLFLVFRVFAPGGEEVVFQGALDPTRPSLRGGSGFPPETGPELSKEYRPYHSTMGSSLNPRRVYGLDVEIWPTCIVVPKDYRHRPDGEGQRL